MCHPGITSVQGSGPRHRLQHAVRRRAPSLARGRVVSLVTKAPAVAGVAEEIADACDDQAMPWIGRYSSIVWSYAASSSLSSHQVSPIGGRLAGSVGHSHPPPQGFVCLLACRQATRNHFQCGRYGQLRNSRQLRARRQWRCSIGRDSGWREACGRWHATTRSQRSTCERSDWCDSPASMVYGHARNVGSNYSVPDPS